MADDSADVREQKTKQTQTREHEVKDNPRKHVDLVSGATMDAIKDFIIAELGEERLAELDVTPLDEQ